MFRKLVANLSFSPALIHEVGFYAKRLRKEETTRRLTLLFVALALVVQSLSVLSPPESANASSEQDLIRGGVASKEDFLARYEQNEASVKDIYSAVGITKAEIERAEEGTINSRGGLLVTSRFAQFGTGQGEVPFSYTKSNGGDIGTVYIAPLQLWDTTATAQYEGTTYQAWIGTSAKLGWFAIMKNSANLTTKVLPTGSSKQDPLMKESIEAINLTQSGVSAHSITAQPGDRISYTLRSENSTKAAQLASFSVPLSDTLEYSRLIDNGGGLLDDQTSALAWPPVKLAPGESQERTFVVQLLDPIPATPAGQSNATSYDCALDTSFGTSTTVQVACPPAKLTESILALFPTIGIGGNILFGVLIAGLSAFFYFRTRQLKTEIRLIRHNLNTGTI